MRVGGDDEPFAALRRDLGVAVQRHEVAAARGGDAGVEAAGVAAVLGQRDDVDRVAEALADEGQRVVGGGVVDEHDLDAGQRLPAQRAEADVEVLAPVPVHDDDGRRHRRVVAGQREVGRWGQAVGRHRINCAPPGGSVKRRSGAGCQSPPEASNASAAGAPAWAMSWTSRAAR